MLIKKIVHTVTFHCRFPGVITTKSIQLKCFTRWRISEMNSQTALIPVVSSLSFQYQEHLFSYSEYPLGVNMCVQTTARSRPRRYVKSHCFTGAYRDMLWSWNVGLMAFSLDFFCFVLGFETTLLRSLYLIYMLIGLSIIFAQDAHAPTMTLYLLSGLFLWPILQGLLWWSDLNLSGWSLLVWSKCFLM